MSPKLLIALCASALVLLAGSVQLTKSHAQAHSQQEAVSEGEYCMTMNGREVGCLTGMGEGRHGAIRDVVAHVVARLDMNKQDVRYAQLTSKEGLNVVMVESGLGSVTSVTLWQNVKDGRITIQYGSEK